MPDTKITALTAIGANPIIPSTFPIPMVDLTDTSMAASGTTKKVTVNQILGAGGTATLASATITGDLTVDTSTLKVDSANNRVGVVNASPSFALDVNGAGSGVSARISSGSGTGFRFDTTRNISGLNRNYLIGCDVLNEGWFSIVPSTALGGGTFTNPIYNASYDGIHAWSDGAGSERMRLNSTGLGVGASPSRKLSVSGAGGGLDVTDTTQSTRIRMRSSSASNFYIEALNSAESAYVTLRLNDTTQIDTSGNVGIGVTPSAWSGNYRVLEIGRSGNAFWGQTGVSGVFMSSNALLNSGGSFVYSNTAASTYYTQNTGRHEWYNAASGTAGNAITFTQAMTLDASGNLLVGKTTNSLATVGFSVQSNGVVASTLAGSTNATDTLDVYSTGASAYRFYVGMGGTVYATNTTISAISDARLKENVQDIDVGLGAILALKPRKFDWKAGKGKDIKGDRGFIAQEFETVFPNLIDEWKDEAPEGEAPYKSVRQDLIPVLVKAIQELTARVQTLETR